MIHVVSLGTFSAVYLLWLWPHLPNETTLDVLLALGVAALAAVLAMWVYVTWRYR
jgi:hypothetical protein